MSFAAKYPGRCLDCGDRFDVGTRVVYSDSRIVHVDCGSEPEPRPVCTKCFTTIAINGTCGCEEDE
jgi:hypothetical protein